MQLEHVTATLDLQAHKQRRIWLGGDSIFVLECMYNCLQRRKLREGDDDIVDKDCQ